MLLLQDPGSVETNRLDGVQPAPEPHATASPPRTSTAEIREAMLAMLPNLRAFAFSLCRNADLADDLVQDTILRAWKNLDRFEPGTNLGAWLFTILRNGFLTQHRRKRRGV